MQHLCKTLIYRIPRNILIQNEIKRYAGHSKWKNIKDVKQLRDKLRSNIFRLLANKMRAVVTMSGDTDPTTNHKLANLIEESKKHHMPAATLNTILQRLRIPPKGETSIITICPSVRGVILVVYVITDNIAKIKPIFRNLAKRFSARIVDNGILSNTFHCASYITVSKNCNLEQAMEDALIVNAQDIEEVDYDDSTYFMFESEFLHPGKVKTQLENLGYTILSVENRTIPLNVIEITAEELQSIDKFKDKLVSEISEIIKIEDNIDES